MGTAMSRQRSAQPRWYARRHRTGQAALADQPAGRFELAVLAFRCGDYHQAETLFVADARDWTADQPQRAAIALRQAALAARARGSLGAARHWLRLAGREYLRAGEDPGVPVTRIREASIMAARCFLTLRDHELAQVALRRIQALEDPPMAPDLRIRDAATGRFPAAWPPPAQDRAGPARPARPAGPARTVRRAGAEARARAYRAG